jgi:hypothetical protein
MEARWIGTEGWNQHSCEEIRLHQAYPRGPKLVVPVTASFYRKEHGDQQHIQQENARVTERIAERKADHSSCSHYSPVGGGFEAQSPRVRARDFR